MMPRKYEPFALTKKEKKDKARAMRKGGCKVTPRSRYCRLVRCIRKIEKRCREDPSTCPRSPVAVCRATIYPRKK